MMAELDLPPIESMSADEARAFSDAMSPQRPPGPEVGEIVDGTLPGAAGDLDYRLYRPATTGPAPGRRLLPRWRLGARQPRLRRSVLPRPVRPHPMPSSSRSTTATPPRPGSRPPPTTRSRPCGGSPTTPSRSVASRVSWPSPGGAPAPTSRPLSASVRRDAGGPADRRPAAGHAGDRLCIRVGVVHRERRRVTCSRQR